MATTDPGPTTIRPLTEETWPLFEALVERHGGIFGGCWCTWFHPDSDEREPGYEAGMVAMIWNLVIVLVAIIAIAVTVPKGGGDRGAEPMAPSAAPRPQLPPDEEKDAILARLAGLSVTQLREAEKHALLGELGHLDPEELRRIVEAGRR